MENQREYYLKLFQSKGHVAAPYGMLNRKGKPHELREDGIFADEGISGTKLKNRDAFLYMIELAEKQLFDTIFVKSISRYSRYIVDGMGVLKKLRSWGVRLIIEDLNIDACDPNNEMMVSMLMTVGQEESRAKSGAVKFGLKSYAKRGGLIGNAPFGYDRRDKFLVVNPEEAEVVKMMFDYYLNQRMGFNAIARILSATVPTKQGGVWRDTTVRGMMTRKIYTGIIESGKVTSFDVNTGQIEHVPEEQWSLVNVPELRIIDDETFNAVQREIERRANNYKATGHKVTQTLLSGLLTCGHCGTSYIRKVRSRGIGHY